MTLRLTVMGGGAAWPNPGQGCSSYLIRSAATTLLLDCGPDTLLELRRHVSLETISAIIISHCHADHILDLVTLRYALVYGMERPGAPIPIWLPPGGVAVLQALGDILGSQGERVDDFWGAAFRLSEYDPDEALDIEGLSVSFARTQHFTPCHAMRLSAPGGPSIVYGADLGRVEHLIEFAAHAGLLVAEATANDNSNVPLEQRGHLTPEDAGRWARLSNVNRLLLSHLWFERPAEQVVARAAGEFPGTIDVATRGLTLYV
jgi:ribonuclease BN (tRNA processing enzyme)